MFRTKEEERVLKKHKHQEMLDMFRKILTRVSNFKKGSFPTQVTARFDESEFAFDITVFAFSHDNVSLTIYDFWEITRSQKLVDKFISAIKTGDFEKVRVAASQRA